LTFNVNTVKNKLKEYYESQGLTTPMFSGGQIAITATLEKLWDLILKECVKRVAKDKSGVRQVNLDMLQYAVILHDGLKRYYASPLALFDENQMYKDQVPVIMAHLDEIMERTDKDLSLTMSARNMACFLLLKAFHDLASTGIIFLDFAKKEIT